MSVHRIPKWLEEMRFNLFHRPSERERRFTITIFPQTPYPPMTGYGNSISAAAKNAIKSKP